MFRAQLQGLSESKKFWAWTKCKDSRRATRFAQTISPSALTSMSGAVSFPYCPERKLNTVSLPAEYGLHMLLFPSDLKPVIIELNS